MQKRVEQARHSLVRSLLIECILLVVVLVLGADLVGGVLPCDLILAALVLIQMPVNGMNSQLDLQVSW